MGSMKHHPVSHALRHGQASPDAVVAGAPVRPDHGDSHAGIPRFGQPGMSPPPESGRTLLRPRHLGFATAAALACLMAGCGDGAPAADPGTSVKATSDASGLAAGQTAGQASEASPDDARNAGDGTTTAPRAEGDAAASPAAATAIDAKGVSGKVLQAMLLEGTSWNGETPVSFAWPAFPWNGPGPKGSPNLDAMSNTPNVHGGQSLSKAEGNDNLYTYGLTTEVIRTGRAAFSGFDFPSLQFSVPMTITGQGYFMPRYEGRQYEGSRDSLSIAFGKQTSVLVSNDQAQRKQSFEASGTPRTIGPNDRFAFNEVVQEWRQPDGSMLQMLLLAGATPREARLCLNMQLPSLRRLNCTIWQVPENIDIGGGITYHGLYVVDDRDASANPAEETPERPGKHLFWQSSPTYPGYTSPAVGPEGVRGDAVAAALTQIVEIIPWGLGEAYRGWSANLWSGPGPDGHPVEREGMPPAIEGWSTFQEPSTAPGATGTHHTRFTSFLHDEYAPQYPNFRFNDLTATVVLEPHLGKYFEGYHDELDSFFTAGRFLFGVDGEPKSGRELLTLGGRVSARAMQGYGPLTEEEALSTENPNNGVVNLFSQRAESLYADRAVSPQRAVQTWTNTGGDKAELWVQPVAQQAPFERQFWLCLQQEVLKTKRATCSRWEVPSEWRIDLPLLFKGIRVVDDQTPDGKPGQVRYWMTNIDRQQMLSTKSLRTQQRKALVRKAMQRASGGGQP